MGSPGSTGELVLVPVTTSVPNIAVLYRAEHLPMVRRLTLMGSPVGLAEQIAHRAFRRAARDWEGLEDPLGVVRRTALDELLARYRPPGRGPTLSPPREGAPPEWHTVSTILDPLSPEERVARVLQVYDGLDDPTGHEPVPPVDIGMAELFADAVADVTPVSHLTELITNRQADAGERLDRVVPAGRRWSMPARGRRWLGGAAAALAIVGVLGNALDSDVVTGAGRGQEVQAGLGPTREWVDAATLGAPQSSCRSADPTLGPGGTPLPDEGSTEPRRVARVLATDRHALVALHRGGRDARIIDREGRVRRTGPNGVGRVRNIDGGTDDQIQVVIESARDCPPSPVAWKGVPLVFTTLVAAAAQPDIVVAGLFADGTPWEVRDRPGYGLCASLGDQAAACGADAGDEQLLPARLLSDGAGRRITFGYLPAGGSIARLEQPGGELGPAVAVPDDATFFALPSEPGDEPESVRFFDQRGAAVTALPYPTAQP